MPIMYKINNNMIVDYCNFADEDAGNAVGYTLLTQDPAPGNGWTRVDESSDFTDTRPYQEQREFAYPQLGEQLDKLYHDIENGTLTTSGDFYTALNTVKTTYPKS